MGKLTEVLQTRLPPAAEFSKPEVSSLPPMRS
jgi:hypothetical protein